MINQQIPENIKQLIKENFPNLNNKLLFDLVAESLVFLGDRHSPIDSLSVEETGELLEHLKKYHNVKIDEERGYRTLGKTNVVPTSRLSTEFTEGKSDDEILSAELLRIKSMTCYPLEENEDEGKTLELMETERDQWQQILSPFEFEALLLKTSNEIEKKPNLTLGFDNLGLFILFRRARIRMLWQNK